VQWRLVTLQQREYRSSLAFAMTLPRRRTRFVECPSDGFFPIFEIFVKQAAVVGRVFRIRPAIYGFYREKFDNLTFPDGKDSAALVALERVRLRAQGALIVRTAKPGNDFVEAKSHELPVLSWS